MKLESTISATKKYLLAVSGGVDSMVLCDLFLKAALPFQVAHCNFKLRGQASTEDELFVKTWCNNAGILCHSKSFDTKTIAENTKISIQETARNLRYQYFDELIKELAIDFVVTAHHQDDSIETTLFHLFRGTGLQGLTGIPAKNNQIIRPLLPYSKEEIYTYANNEQIAYRQDQSNSETKYTRNQIRLDIIPFIEKSFPLAKKNIAKTIAHLQDVQHLVEQRMDYYEKQLVETRGQDIYIPIRKLKNCHPLSTIFYLLLKKYQFSFEQSQEVLKMMNTQGGSYVENKDYKIIHHGNFFIITKKVATQTDFLFYDTVLPQTIQTPFQTIQTKLLKTDQLKIQKEKAFCYIDTQMLSYPILFRPWKQGDYMYPFGLNKKKKIARILIDEKIPLHEKEKIWVMVSNEKIVWLLGLKTDHRFRVTEKTKEVFCLQLK
ncbi:MAG: tRNA lysidine(34) synthetase TilS [Chitinophagaceae bacterium]